MPVDVLLSNGKAIPVTAMELYRKSGQRNGIEPTSQGAALTGTVTTCSGIAKRDSATAKLAKDTPRNSSSLRRQAAAGRSVYKRRHCKEKSSSDNRKNSIGRANGSNDVPRRSGARRGMPGYV